jgi:hypothetical protein
MLTPKKIYLDARRMAWAAIIADVTIMGASLWLLGADSVPIVTVGLPILGVVVTAYVGTEKGWGIWSPPKEGEQE